MFPGVNFNAFNLVDLTATGRVDLQDDHARYGHLPPFSSLPNNTLPLNKPHANTLIGLGVRPAP